MVKVIMIGDVVGEPGLEALEKKLLSLIRDWEADFTVVNGENAAGGFGLGGAELRRILAAGADAITSGNHIWEKREFWPLLESESRLLRPANYPPGSPGRGAALIEKPSRRGGQGGGAPETWLVINLQGREFMQNIDCPFRCFDRLVGDLDGEKKPLILVDFHAESPEEKESLAFYLDGRASLVAGTHTHVQTADARLLPRGTACISDLGMTGIQDSVIGMDPGICLDRARFQVLYRMECAKPGPGAGEAAVQGALTEIDGETGKALSIRAFTE